MICSVHKVSVLGLFNFMRTLRSPQLSDFLVSENITFEGWILSDNNTYMTKKESLKKCVTYGTSGFFLD